MPTKPSDLTITDLFCGAGGSSIGASQAGGRLRLGLNHWDLAIETHNTNFPDADHDCTDIQATDPRRYYSTQILIASPECTNHSLAKGQKRKVHQRDLFVPQQDDPAAQRSRATMWDVPRFAEVHDYDIVIVENVVDARRWIMYDAWLLAMASLGYDHQAVYLNSMFAHPTPQSRDRMYVVFWKRGNRPPDLNFEPPAWCPSCEARVESVQSWKPGRTWGRYGDGNQYVYLCPRCAGDVVPYYFAALNAIDFSVAAERIGDRKRPLKERTLERIRFGLEKYGREPLVVRVNMTSGVECRVRGAAGEPLDTQPASNITALVSPWLLESGYGSKGAELARGVDEPLRTQTTGQTQALAIPPGFVMTYRRSGDGGYPVAPFTDPLNTTVANPQDYVVLGPGAALMTLRDHPRFVFNELDEALPTQVAAGQQTAVIARAPFLVPYYRTGNPTGMHEPIPTLPALDKFGLTGPGEEPDVDDCYFRMLQPHEIQAGMAFPGDYTVHGTKRDQVKQLGNAVTPPVMRELIRRAIRSLEGEAA